MAIIGDVAKTACAAGGTAIGGPVGGIVGGVVGKVAGDVLEKKVGQDLQSLLNGSNKA